MTTIMVVITIAITSCTKEEVQTPINQNQIQNSGFRIFENDWDLPTGEIKNLSDNYELKMAVESSNEYLQVLNKTELEKDSSKIVCYGNPNKFSVVIPSKKEANIYYSFTFTELQINHCKKIELTGTEDYLNQMPGSILFADQDIPWSGEVKIYDLDDKLEATIGVQDGSAKPVWTHHGGFGSWTDCIEHYGSQWWAIIGGFICPPIVIGLAIGCL